MAVFKKVMKNLLITIGICLGLFFICLGIMYFAKISLFGLKFKDAPINAISIQNLDETKCNSIVLNLGNVNLDIVETKDDEVFNFSLRDDCRGLCKKDYAQLTYTITTQKQGDNFNILININEPQGWLFWKNTWATLTLSENLLADENLKIVVNSTKGDAYVKTNLKHLNFTSTNNGNLNAFSQIQTLKIETNKGDAVLKESCQDVDFKTNKGEIHFTTFNNLNIEGTNPYVRGNQVYSSFNFISENGKIEIGTVGNKTIADDENIGIGSDEGYNQNWVITLAELNIETQKTLIKIDNVYAKTKITTTKGKVEIKNLANQEVYNNSITTTKGNVKIDCVYSKHLNVTTDKGEIKVALCGLEGNVVLSSVKGKIIVDGKANFEISKSREAFSREYVQGFAAQYYNGNLKTTNTKGRTILTNIKCVLDVNVIKKGQVDAEILEVKGLSKIASNDGKINVNLKLTPHTLQATSTKNKVDVEFKALGIDLLDKSHTLQTVNVNGGSVANVLTITTSKAITVNAI